MTGIEALQALRNGQKVRRPAWEETYVAMHYLGRGSDIWEIEYVPNTEYETIDEDDLLEYDDWEIVE